MKEGDGAALHDEGIIRVAAEADSELTWHELVRHFAGGHRSSGGQVGRPVCNRV
jgi:hypothetical protein